MAGVSTCGPGVSFDLRGIGVVRSPLTDPAECPKQGFEGGARAVIEIDPACADALDGLAPGRDILLFTWLDQADRTRLKSRPRGAARAEPKGVFSIRSPHRPNPIGLHRVRILDMHGPRLTVEPLEVLDGTPVIDLKPVLDREADSALAAELAPEGLSLLREAGRRAWERGLISGFNGNLSVRQAGTALITAAGCQKGLLAACDVAVADIASGETISGRASTETPMHLAVYRAQPAAMAIVHVHPPHLLALSLRGQACAQALRDLPLFEAGLFVDQLGSVTALPLGSWELAEAVGAQAQMRRAVFMEGHGLTCWGGSLLDALGLAEELDGLARIALLAG